jgi:hypothetical protein
MKTQIEPRLDCIEMKREIQRQIAQETKGMTPAQRLAYYKRLAAESPFAKKLKEQRQESNKRNSHQRILQTVREGVEKQLK